MKIRRHPTSRAVRCLFGGLLAWQLLLGGPLAVAGSPLENQLKDHPAPYLAMHADDPVRWQTWGEQALQKAQRLNRLLFISSGYFSCHWCHVMQHESYQNPAIADLLNTYFIPVKVDRELNPALDAHLIEFVELTRGQAGWPLNVFLTPDGYPLFGMTYMPAERFNLLLQQLQQQWSKDEAELRQAAQNAMQEWRRLSQDQTQRTAVSTDIVKTMLQQTNKRKDELAGGFGQQNKFPMVSQLQALLFLKQQGQAAVPDDFIRLTLDRMADQGLHDNLGGGFFRYVTDPGWHTPHYEKMLYGNAQLAALYLDAASVYDEERYRALGLDTVDFMLRDMSHPGGGFMGSFSAVDDLGREGFYYLWNQQQLAGLLSDAELKAVLTAWFDAPVAEAESGRLPRWQGTPAVIAKKLGWTTNRFQRELATAREKMLVSRAGRHLPADDKVLAAWNGLVLSALAKAYALSGEEIYKKRAQQLAGYLAETLWDGQQLLRARQNGKLMAEASLEDYALVAQGLWDWSLQKQAGWQSLQSRSEQLVRIAWKRYYRKGLWRNSDTALIPMLEGRLAAEDSPLPSATAVLSRLTMLQPGLQAGKADQQRLQQHLQNVRARLGDSIFWYAGYVALLAEP